MGNDRILKTLCVGVDISLKKNVAAAISFHGDKKLTGSFPNTPEGTERMIGQIAGALKGTGELEHVVMACEATSACSFHFSNAASTAEELRPFNCEAYCVNPMQAASCKKTFINLGKNDWVDSCAIADFARVGKTATEPWRGMERVGLQRPARARRHLKKSIAREKPCMLANLFITFSGLVTADAEDEPFSSLFGAAASPVISELSPEMIASMGVDELVDCICAKGKNHFKDPLKTATLLMQASDRSFKLRDSASDSLCVAIRSSLGCIGAMEKEASALAKAIEKTVQRIYPNESLMLQSIKGVGKVLSAGMLAEIGPAGNFRSSDALAKYAGIVWNDRQPGDFDGEDRDMSRAGNPHLRDYIIEATWSAVQRGVPELKSYYGLKFNESTKHKHKRALALTSRKFARLLFGLLDKDQLYSPRRVNAES